MKRRQQGVGGFLIAVVLLFAIAGLVAALSLYSRRSGGDRDAAVGTGLTAARDALEQFAATERRLPCPADPGGTTGVAAPDAASAICTFPTGSLPWRTLGLRAEQALDSAGNRISYRVYTGNAGSLTQADGPSMLNCDTDENWPQGRTAVVGSAGGLCRATQDTTPAEYLLGKGLSVTDMGTAYTDAAYVLISHGSTGRGGFTAAGVQRSAPANADEIANTTAAGPYIRKAASTGLLETDANFFDDVLVYARLGDLARRARLEARNWPDIVPLPPGATRFDLATVAARPGVTISGTGTGQSVIDFGPVSVVGVASGSLAEISFASPGGTGGLGVTVGANPKMTWGESEWLIFIFDDMGSKFGMTLSDFGTFLQAGTTMTETVAMYFYRNGNPVATLVRNACRADGQLASFDIDVGTNYDAVIVAPIASTGISGGTPVTGDTGFLIAEVRTCGNSDPNCRTGLSSAANTCP